MTAAPQVIVHPTVDLTTRGIAARLVAHLIERQSLTSPIHLSVTGGALGNGLWPALAADPAVEAIDWSGVHVWFSDERFVPEGDADRNDLPVLAVAERFGLPRENVHSVPGPDRVPTVEDAAREYAAELARSAGAEPGVPTPVFDVSVLGIGPDGHVASLFPGRDESSAYKGTTLPVLDSPKPPPQRVTFTRAALEHCQELWLIAAGAPKAQAVGRALRGDDPVRTPASGLRGRARTLWLIDSTLAARLT
ncbi:MAG: 6-phosphogluconolactonase [Actinomycetia bacterium]|nr:6-phosphogluconolactonase [Actinomycetes bacterium]